MTHRSRRRATEIGWDTDDDGSLCKFILKKSSKKASLTSSSSSSSSSTSSTRLSPISGIAPSNAAGQRWESRDEGERDVGLQFDEDASLHKMLGRRRALALGKFKILTTDGEEEFLEETPEFLAAVHRPDSIRYQVRPPGFSGTSFPRRTRYSVLKFDYPGWGERHHVLWTSEDEEIHCDRMVKLYDLSSIHTHEIVCDSEGPRSPWFGLVDPRQTQTHDGKVGFDANMFWTVGLLYKHLGTCGVEVWDHEIAEMAEAYKTSAVAAAALPPPEVGGGGLPSHLLLNCPPATVTAPPPLPVSPLPTTAAKSHSNFQVGLRYTGCVVDWRKSFGFLSCTLIPERIFLHVNDVKGDGSYVAPLPLGTSINFELALDEVKKSFKAVKALAFL